MNRKVFILRGLPGSGKSTWAARKLEEYPDHFTRPRIRSADDYFQTRDGYKFDPTKLQEAHNECLLCYTKDICDGYYKADKYNQFDIILDNTNTTALEIAPYLRVAQAFGWDVEIVEFPCTLHDSLSRNIHDVPLRTIERMRDRMEDFLPVSWQQYVVNVDPEWFNERSTNEEERSEVGPTSETEKQVHGEDHKDMFRSNRQQTL